jgi:hypothetical protein
MNDDPAPADKPTGTADRDTANTDDTDADVDVDVDADADARLSRRDGMSAWSTIERGNLTFSRPRFGGESMLFVRESASASAQPGTKAGTTTTTTGTGRMRVFRGRDLDSIVSTNAELRTHNDIEPLRAQLKTDIATDATIKPDASLRATVEGENLVLERTATDARLFVKQDGREFVHVGPDFDTIVRTNPEIQRIPEFATFRTRVVEVDRLPLSAHVDGNTQLLVRHTPSGVLVNTWDLRDGRWVAANYRGRTIADIQEPEFRTVWTRWTSAPTVPVVQPAARVTTTTEPGCILARPAAEVDAKYRLEHKGAVVTEVRPGTFASTIGLRPNDVIVEINGESVPSHEVAMSPGR